MSYRERLVVDGRPVSEATFARLVGEVLAAVDRVPARLGEPTEFEILTAVIFRWFAEQDLDVALVEVGLGGRLDATHAWDGGVAVVTNVDLDHQDRLGSTVTAIAREKAAIIERGDRRRDRGASGDALAVIRRRARRLDVPADRGRGRRRCSAGIATGSRWTSAGSGRPGSGCAAATRPPTSRSPTRCWTPSRRPGSRASTPMLAGRAMRLSRWPGRLERLDVDGREWLLDGAHNPAGAAALADALDDLRPYLAPGPITLLTASMADKDVAGVVAALARAGALADATIVCTAVDVPRALPAEDLAGALARRATGRPPSRAGRTDRRGRPATGDGRGRRARSSSPARCTWSGRSAAP